MRVYVLVREDQNDHGFVDVSVDGIFRSKADAESLQRNEEADARGRGLLVDGETQPEADWQVSWKIEEHDVQ
jgi:hypothetical protein